MGDNQQLVDRLVVVTEEQDVLWVLILIQQMKELGCLQEAINATHSWKGYSALDSIALRSSISTLHKFIARLLLLSEAISQLEDRANEQFRAMLNEWRNGGQEAAREAKHLLSPDLAQAADWIDENLPSPPNPESLTGEGPLPLLSDLFDSAETQSSRIRSSTPPSPIQIVAPSPTNFVDSQTQEDSTNRLPITLLLSGLPDSFSLAKLSQVFIDIGVTPVALRCGSKYCAFADVEFLEVEHCIDSLDRKLIDGRKRISCWLANYPTRVPHTLDPIEQTNSPRSPKLGSRFDKSSAGSTPSNDRSRLTLPSASWTSDRAMPPITTLHLAGLPLHFGSAEIKKLFSSIAVTPLAIRSGIFSSKNNYANVDVETNQVLRCTTSLQGKQLEYQYQISCYVSQPRGGTGGQRGSVGGRRGGGARQSGPRDSSILHLASVPPHFDTIHVARLFLDIGVQPLGLRLIDCDPRRRKPFAFVEVKSEDEKHCQEALDGVEVEGSTVSCSPASSQSREPLPPLPSLHHPSSRTSRNVSRIPSLPLPFSSAPRPPSRSRSPTSTHQARFFYYPSPPTSHHARSRSRSPPPRQSRFDYRSDESTRAPRSVSPPATRVIGHSGASCIT
ncbi:hypothetical protein JCM5350_007508 [Sporobolomyces pararoseus]